MPAPAARLPEHEATYRRLRDLLLFGALAPGQKVTIQGIAADLGAGMTPVREAIRRLTAEGALEPHDNRRVSVPVLSARNLDEVVHARLQLEPHLAALALPRVTPAIIDSIVDLDRSVDAAIAEGDLTGYLAGNWRFHFALYDAADAPILTGLTQSLWLRFGPSLRAVMARGAPPGPDRHKDAIAALRAGDAGALRAAISADIEQGLERMRAALR
jgi:DNA-binding GntR family transcriptional regulator